MSSNADIGQAERAAESAPREEEAPAASAAKEGLEARRLHPVTLLQRVLVSIPALLFLLLPVFFRGEEDGAWTGVIFALMYVAIALPAFVLQYLRFSYWVTPREIVIQSGVLKRNNRSIPIERVQNIQIIQSLVPRMFGTAKVKIETAGSGTTEGVLEYVKVSEAQRLRQTVRAFQRGQATPQDRPVDSIAPDTGAYLEPDEPSAPEPARQLLHRMPLSRVMLSGVFRFSLLFIALIFSILSYIPDFETMLFQWLEQGELRWIADAAAEYPFLTVLATIFIAALLAWITGALLNLNRYYDFELWLEEDKLYRKHGLLTRSEGNIPLEKVQALILRSNPVMRTFGWYILELQTMGVDTDQQGHQVAIPFAKKEEIVELAQHIRPFELPESFSSVSPITIRRMFIRYGSLVAAASALVGHLLWAPGWWGLAFLPLVLLYSYRRYTNHGYAQAEEQFFVRGGVFRYHIWILPTEKHQVFYNMSSIFQRRLGLKSLAVDTAGAGGLGYPDVIDLPAEEADALLDDLYSKFTGFFRSAEVASEPETG